MKTVRNLFLISDILLFIFLSLFIYSSISKKDISNDEVLGANMNVIVEEESIPIEKEYVLNICAKKLCIDISEKEIKTDGNIDRGKISEIVLNRILPFFEKNFGGVSTISSPNGSFIYWKNDYHPNLVNIEESIYVMTTNRTIDILTLDVGYLPGTDGKYRNKYIEIDNSRQILYVWINGEVKKEIYLSAAKYGYQVYGVFPIIDKGLSPQAPSGRYMPYWMAFYYSKEHNTYYGLHSLIWWYDENGKVIYEPNSNIGVRRSRGCIRMLKGDAKYLYDIFDKGDLVLIHE